MLRIPVESNARRAASAWVEVDLGAITRNVRGFLARLPAGCRLTAVVKSEAYGHGMLPVARAALRAGAHELAVANVPEGAALREAGVRAPILVAGPITPAAAPQVVQYGLVPTVACYEVAAALARATRRQLPVQVEVDTGMRRHGVPVHDLDGFVRALSERGRLSVAGVYTHFAGLTAEDEQGLRDQLARFHAAVDGVAGLRGVRRHACNTLGALLLPDAALDGVRIGGGLYGFDPLGGARGQLEPALSWKAQVVGLREVASGDRVGYGGRFVCERRSRLALLPVGYGDGLARELWSGADVLVRGRRAPLVGAISMNQALVDVTDLPEVLLGEEVVLLGGVAGERLRPEDRAPDGGCAYEVTSLLSPRLPRVYVGEAAAARGAKLQAVERRLSEPQVRPQREVRSPRR